MGLPRSAVRCGLPPRPGRPRKTGCCSARSAAAVWADYLEAVLLTVNGWASWCAYLGWQARLEGRDDDPSARPAGDPPGMGRDPAGIQDRQDNTERWARCRPPGEGACRAAQAEEALLVDEVWQLALEAGYQRSWPGGCAMARRPTPRGHRGAGRLCIDVRSEPTRRALEAVARHPDGRVCRLFGLPVAYTPLATEARRPQLPGLLAPAMDVTDQI